VWHRGTQGKRLRVRCVLGVPRVAGVVQCPSAAGGAEPRKLSPAPSVTQLAGRNRRVVTSRRLQPLRCHIATVRTSRGPAGSQVPEGARGHAERMDVRARRRPGWSRPLCRTVTATVAMWHGCAVRRPSPDERHPGESHQRPHQPHQWPRRLREQSTRITVGQKPAITRVAAHDDARSHARSHRKRTCRRVPGSLRSLR